MTVNQIVKSLLCSALMSVAASGYGGVSISVGDFSFEDVLVSSSPAVVDGPGTWAAAWGGGFANRSFQAQPALYPNQHGDYLGNIYVTNTGNFAALYQDVVRIEPGIYTFTVSVGHEPGAEPTAAPFLINFEATGYGVGTVLLDSFSFPVGTVGSDQLVDLSVNLTIPAGHAQIGRNLRPVLLTTGADAGTNPLDPRGSYMIDDVRLDFQPLSGPTTAVRVGEFSFDPLTWNRPFSNGGNVGLYRPQSTLFPSQDGDQLGALSVRNIAGSWAALWQDTDAVIQPGKFSLTVGVAHDPNYEPTVAPFRINFESVSSTGAVSFLGGTEFAVGAANGLDLTDLTATLDIPIGSAQTGDTLRVVLLMNDPESGSNPGAVDPRATYLLDNIRLEFTAIPEPSTTCVTLIGMTLICGVRYRIK